MPKSKQRGKKKGSTFDKQWTASWMQAKFKSLEFIFNEFLGRSLSDENETNWDTQESPSSPISKSIVQWNQCTLEKK